jgi:hypothetical protein
VSHGIDLFHEWWQRYADTIGQGLGDPFFNAAHIKWHQHGLTTTLIDHHGAAQFEGTA